MHLTTHRGPFTRRGGAVLHRSRSGWHSGTPVWMAWVVQEARGPVSARRFSRRNRAPDGHGRGRVGLLARPTAPGYARSRDAGDGPAGVSQLTADETSDWQARRAGRVMFHETARADIAFINDLWLCAVVIRYQEITKIKSLKITSVPKRHGTVAELVLRLGYYNRITVSST